MNIAHDKTASMSPNGWALITGGTSGIGLAFARRLAQRGYSLVLVARNKTKLEQTAQEFAERGVRVDVIQADLTTEDGVNAVIDRVKSDDNPIDVLVNNAGTGLYHSLATTDFRDIDQAAVVMAEAPMKIGGAAATQMKKRGKGHIINISSVQSFVPTGPYASFKALIRMWSESLSGELHGTGVRATVVMPGWVRSGFHKSGKRSGVPDALWLEPDTVAIEGLKAAFQGKTRCVPSTRYKIIAFLAEKAPRGAVNWVGRKISGSKGGHR
ncbi:SDR family NAD(P)-dependent oxidoreductase [Actinotignum urinale]|uniref:SDR family oxidoreductase n=1 Tax=Actinotignum urinale TaxID=190146 RepID=A0AAW9HKD8_9ACTO|nr:SDR family oxidoreductase [Actinotignum urinale]MDY5133045.1 SDR family oxidoreductase [Actinotignum urinale]MDY5154252.1 SDR family oxidoreductase [Actinotignum urinale]MDY5159600.1 SDR family oxidoreductase [Actinotignum urinale]WIK58439.1 SDR family oxidoreductase [Actinotignum urinale]